jgi:hypothetical protein
MGEPSLPQSMVSQRRPSRSSVAIAEPSSGEGIADALQRKDQAAMS